MSQGPCGVYCITVYVFCLVVVFMPSQSFAPRLRTPRQILFMLSKWSVANSNVFDPPVTHRMCE